MKAAVLHATGRPPRCEEFTEPAANGNEVLVHVRAAALKPLDKQMASGSHYASYREFPAVCGTDGVGQSDDGTRVFFAGPRPPFGTMADRTVVHRARCFRLPDTISDDIAAAVVNPGLSAWGSLVWRAQLVPGETVLILGATGVTGKLAIQTAKLLGATRVVAAGRNAQSLETLRKLGADATILIGTSGQELTDAFAREARVAPFNVILDYLWGAPTEALLAAITRKDLQPSETRVRLVEVGESAGPTISLRGGTLRSSRLEILGAGTGSAPTSPEVWKEALAELLDNVMKGSLCIDTVRIPLADVEDAWPRDYQGRRAVLIP